MTHEFKTIRTIPRERTTMPEQAPAERVHNFSEVALGFGVEHAVREADRCLDCNDPRCLRGCPVAVDIPGFLRKVAQKDYRGAYDVLAHTNVLPAICGRVCPQEDQCEGVCSVGDALEPVAIGRVERWLGDLAIEQGWSSAPHVPKNGFRVGIVGSGPAGIACAADLARLGCEVTVFDALHAPGGVLRYGIPEFRLPKRVVDAELEKLRQWGVTIECNTLVGRLFTIEQMIDELGFHAVFIATGAGLPKFMGIPGEGLNGVVSANELLTRCNLMQAGKFPDFDTPLGLGRRVAVIGSGNTAMDALRVALRCGAEQVMCVYRRSREECPARAEELHHAEQEGVAFHWLTNPIEIVDDGTGSVRGLRCLRMQLGEPDASGRRRPVPVPGSEFELDADMVVYAIGTNANPIIGQTARIALNRWGYIETDANLATSLAGVYAGGDIVTGSATVILAMGAGRRAARSIAGYLGIAEPEPEAPGVFGIDRARHSYVRMRASAVAPPPSAAELCAAALRPVLALEGLRHAYPLVLVREPAPGAAPVQSLRELVDRVVAAQHGDGFARAALALEDRMRRLALATPTQPELAAVGCEAKRVLLEQAQASEREALASDFDALLTALPHGTLVACDAQGLEAVVQCYWRQHDAPRAHAVQGELTALQATLATLARSDFMHTPQAWSPRALAASIGARQRDDFDLDALSRLLTPLRAQASNAPRLAQLRVLERALADSEVLRLPASAWVFRSCAAAIEALDRRRRELSTLLATLTARDVVNTAYAATEESSVRALLPSSLLLLDADRLSDHEQVLLLELLATGLPITVLCASARLDAALLPDALPTVESSLGGRAAMLATLARGLGSVFVMQSALSQLPCCLDELTSALAFAGPCLIAVYTGESHPQLPPYLAAAAARASRLFPNWVFDPTARRLSLAANPAPEASWARAPFACEDAALQRIENDEAFTPAHLFAARPEFLAYAQPVASAAWDEHFAPLDRWLDAGSDTAKPYVTMVDDHARVLRVVVSGPILEHTRRVAEHWRTLQRMAAEAEPQPAPHAEPEPPAADATAQRSEPVEQPASAPSSEAPAGAYIESRRCSSCDECVRRSPRMFVYDQDKRAVLRDVRAGSYRELVEAAERCRMAIIHPGLPWDETEPDLDELRHRAAAFA